jgi:hypothetical protein
MHEAYPSAEAKAGLSAVDSRQYWEDATAIVDYKPRRR